MHWICATPFSSGCRIISIENSICVGTKAFNPNFDNSKDLGSLLEDTTRLFNNNGLKRTFSAKYVIGPTLILARLRLNYYRHQNCLWFDL